jgi:leader peptidase (prepilin peptidase)/N-methyltransferase
VILLEILFIALIGLVLGSFVGALTWRFPRHESILKGRSHCDNCRKKIAWFDNIPLFSFFVLRGRCRYCHKPISIRYPLIEASTALIFMAIFGTMIFNWIYFFYLLALSVLLISIFVIDLEHRIIPDEFVFLAYGLVFLALFLSNNPLFFQHLFLGYLAALFLLVVHLATKGKGMGLGDVKFVLVGGTFFGWPLTPLWLFIAFLTGAIVGIILIILGKTKFGRQIAFSPFLVISFLIVLIWGNSLLNLII